MESNKQRITEGLEYCIYLSGSGLNRTETGKKIAEMNDREALNEVLKVIDIINIKLKLLAELVASELASH
jgi:hypothetical protein